MIRAIIFDLFGVVLADSLLAMRDELAKKNPENAREVKDLVRASAKGLIMPDESYQRLSKLFGLTPEEYRARLMEGEVRNQALLDYILELRKSYKVGMLSNVSNGGLLRRFRVDELDKYFDATVASAEVGYAKPEPEAYEIIADRLSVRLDECVFTDDREVYTEGARAVGMQGIVYTDFAQFKTDLENLLADS